MKKIELIIIVLITFVSCTKKLKLSQLNKEIITFGEMPRSVQKEVIWMMSKKSNTIGISNPEFRNLDSKYREIHFWSDTVPSSGKLWSRIIYENKVEIIIDNGMIKFYSPYVVENNILYYRVSRDLWSEEKIKNGKYGRVDLNQIEK